MMDIAMRIVREVWDLFVDDGSLAVLLILWAAVVGLAVALLGSDHGIGGPALVLGVILILIENVRRFAARKGRPGRRR